MGRLSEFKSALAPLQTEQCEPPVKTHTLTHTPTYTHTDIQIHGFGQTRAAHAVPTAEQLCALELHRDANWSAYTDTYLVFQEDRRQCGSEGQSGAGESI